MTSRSEQAAAKKADELTEALGHLTYFRNRRMGLEFAIPKMKEDLRLCEKNITIWEQRIAKMEEKKVEGHGTLSGIGVRRYE